MKPRHAGASGFSLVELVTIMVVLGILAAFAIPRFVDRTGFESRGVYDQAQGIVRYAQKIAIAQRQSPPKQPIFVVITASQISICYDAACAAAVTDPISGAALTLPTPPGGAVTFFSPVPTFSFSGSGAPSLVAQLEIRVNSTGVGDINRAFFVEPVTGYVHPYFELRVSSFEFRVNVYSTSSGGFALPKLATRNPQPATRNSQLETVDHQLETRNSKLET